MTPAQRRHWQQGDETAQAETGSQGAATPLDLGNAEGLEALTQAIANLSADDRARLAMMIAHDNGGKGGNPF